MKQIALIFLLFGPAIIFSQKIKNVNFKLKDSKAIVVYDLDSCQPKTVVTVSLSFIDTANGIINPESIAGDIIRVKQGKHRRIIWNTLQDTFSFVGKYQAKLEVINVEDKINYAGYPPYCLWSMALPGVGDFFVRDRYTGIRPGTIMLAYGLGVACTGQNYLKYKQARREENDLSKQFSSTSSSVDAATLRQSKENTATMKRRTIISAGFTGAVWLGDVIYVLSKWWIDWKPTVRYQNHRNMVYVNPSPFNPGITYVRNFK